LSRGDTSTQVMKQILDHIKASNMVAGQHLPAQQLADAFQLSRAPVISALAKLAKIGVVIAEERRGYFLAKNAADLPDLTGEARPEDSLYFKIAEDRLAGKIADRISENELMRTYGVARSRLLKILHQMAEEGWIDRLPGNGWLFRETLTSKKAYADAYQFRASIETQAILLPSFQVNQPLFDQAREHQTMLLQSFESKSRVAIFSTNIDFHEMLMQCANNSFFLDAVRRVNRVRRLIEYHITTDRSRLPQQCREHLEILNLIESGNMQSAANYLYRHIYEAGQLKSAALQD
jgi:DNA-binding GntR family transcriptional regulator